VTETVLHRFCNALSHRGPDDEGREILRTNCERSPLLGIVHRRLSILDLSRAAHQPMSNHDRSVWITYNGEIYNYREITCELETKGYKFQSESDTEAVLHAYEEWGMECLQRFRGMFAFAIWDNREKILFLAVDRFGIKPLYYYDEKDEPFMFASEVRALLKSGLVEKRIDPVAVDSFLAYGAVQAPLSIIRKVKALLPAHYLIHYLSSRHNKIVQYWKPSEKLTENPIHNKDQATENVRAILEDCIRKHLVSDVPVAAFLSGGIDSSSVVAIANRLNQGTLRSFSVTFEESQFSEDKYSQLIADMYCRNHVEIKISQDDLLSLLPQALSAMDQPTIDGINTYAISKAVSERGIKTVLSGQGGDEVFGGYSTFKRIPFIQQLFRFVPSSLRKVASLLLRIGPTQFLTRSKYKQILESPGDPLSLYFILRQLFSPEARKLLMERQFGEGSFHGVPGVVIEGLTEELNRLDICNSVSLLEFRLYLANMLLRDGDFMSMAHGLEVRVPFLDHELVEYIFNISPRIKMRNSVPKPLLVHAMKDLLPETIYLRPKMGFSFPWDLWLRDKIRPQIEEILYEFHQVDEIGIQLEQCRSLWRSYLIRTPGITWARIWAIYVLLRWYERNILT